MRDLTRPQVLTSAVTAALATTLACYPRLAQWTERLEALWVLVGFLFGCALVMWGFVLAWHTRYTGRPVVAKPEVKGIIFVVACAALFGAVFHFWFDPIIRAKMPGEYPANLHQWVSMTLFVIGFQQLFLLFGPLAFFSRILGNGRWAVFLTLFFGGLVIVMKAEPVTSALPWLVSFGFLVVRMLAGLLSIYFYLRGGVVLAYVWTLLVQARELFDLCPS